MKKEKKILIIFQFLTITNSTINLGDIMVLHFISDSVHHHIILHTPITPLLILPMVRSLVDILALNMEDSEEEEVEVLQEDGK